ncbi:MAG: sigma-54 factor interaction domain-containing protein [Desulfobaccales bacterium]
MGSEVAKIKATGDEIVGVSKHIKSLRRNIKEAAQGDKDVLILGPSGTGKELVARAIHQQSQRNTGPLISLDCAAIPSELFISELFGHKKGSFTGAYQDMKGKVAEAEGGTLFLDEIGNLRPDHQVMLLRFLEERAYRMVGGNELKKTNIRIIFATNKTNLATGSEGHFKEDLYYRMNQHMIITEALKNRYDDVVFYVNYFNRNINVRTKCLLYSYGFPGNVRELLNLVEHSSSYVRGYIRMRLAEQLKISNGMEAKAQESSYWKGYLSNYVVNESYEKDILYSTFVFNRMHIKNLKKIVDLYEIITLLSYAKLTKVATRDVLHIRDENLTPKIFRERFGYSLPEGRNITIGNDETDCRKLPREPMKLYPEFINFFEFYQYVNLDRKK